MELKPLNEYTKRELLELIVSNQVRTEQRIFKIYAFLTEKYKDEFAKHNQDKVTTFQDFVSSIDELTIDINEELSKD